MQVYFDRTAPLYLTTQPSFDAVAVDVDTEDLELVQSLRLLLQDMKIRINDAAGPEHANQELASRFVEGLNDIMRRYNDDGGE